MINKLVTNIKKTGAPIVVGLDPMLSYVPEQVQKKAFAEYGETLEGAAEAIWQFNKEIVDKTYDLIPSRTCCHSGSKKSYCHHRRDHGTPCRMADRRKRSCPQI